MKKLHIIILFLMTWSFSYAQQYTNYTTKNGLPSNHIYKITQDYQGFIWLITDKGMVKYNGKTFKTFTTKDGLPTNDIWDIRIGHDNKIWFFTKATRLGYIENDKVYAFESAHKGEILYPVTISQNTNNISFSNSIQYYELKDSLWKSKPLNTIVGYGEFISHPKIKSLLLKKEKDSLFLIDKNKKIKAIKTSNFSFDYRGQVNDSLFCWLSNKSTFFLNLNTLKFIETKFNFKPKKFVRFTAVNNKLQISGENFVSFIDADLQLTNLTHIPEALNSHFSFIDKNNNLWIATFSNGVYFLPASKRVSKYCLQDKKVSKLQNVNGDLVASVYKKGFYKYDTRQNKFISFLPINDFIFNACYINELDTYYYIANEQVIIIKNNKKTHKRNFDLARNIVYYKGYLYSNTSFGLSKINPKNFNLEKEYFQNGIRNILLFKDKLLLATASGIKQLSNDKILPVSIGNDLFDKPLTSLSKFNETELIVGTEGFGAYITDLHKVELLEQSEYLNIQSSFINKDDIWLATNKGVWHYKKGNKTIKLIRKYTTNDGLSLDQINAVCIQGDKLIASSNDGISIIPINQKENNQFIDIYFDELTYNNHKITQPKFTYKANNHLQVKVASIDFSSNTEFKYQYQLLPIQNNWISTTSGQISFNDLPPNTYQLNIQSHHKKKQINFEIIPLWYQTLFAKIIFAFITLFLFAGILLTLRKKELKKQQKKLEAQKKIAEYELHALRSQMNPHFVFNSLNAIQYYITKNNIELSEKYLVKFARLIRMFFDFSREKEIPITDEIKLLKGYLEIEKMRFGDDFNYKVNVKHHENMEAYKIPTMLLQPIVENAVNHGLFHQKGKGLIEITFDLVSKTKMIVTISDNGVGIKKSKEIQQNSIRQHKKNNSTQVIKERIALLNQSNKWKVYYNIIEKEIGTTVQLSFTKNEEN